LTPPGDPTGGWLGPAAAFLSSVTWAVAATIYSRLSLKTNAFAVNVTRALFALPCFFLAAVVTGWGDLAGAFRLPAENLGWLALSVVGSYALGDALFFRSTHALGVPGALSIASTYPLWSALAGWLVRGERMGLTGVAGLVMVVGGVVTVIRSRSGAEAASHGGRARGVLLAVATSLFWALNAYAISRGGKGVSPAAANTVRMAAVLAVVPLAGRLTMGARAALVVPWADARPAAWLFVLEGFGGSMLFLLGMTRSPLAIGAALSSLAPVVSVPFAVLSGRERFSLATTLGVIVVVSGIVLLVGARGA
jgi:drug/metabolite transporter (DMT)-like permease